MRKIILFLVFGFLFAQVQYSQTPKRIKLGIVNGKAILLPKPDYPEKAKNSCIGGQVKVQVEIDKKGDVISAEAISGNEILFEPSVTAAKKAKFTHSPLPPININGIIVYNFDSHVKCEKNELLFERSIDENIATISLGVLNDKAKILPMPKVPKELAYIDATGNVNIAIKLNIQTGKVVSATAVSGFDLYRKYVVEAAMKSKFEPALTEFPTIYGVGILVYNREDFNGKTIENENAKIISVIGKGVLNGSAIEMQRPEYPEESQRKCIGGKVEVAILIYAQTSKIISVKAISGNELLRESAEKAALLAKFRSTATHGDKIFYVKGVLVYNFQPITKCLELGKIVNDSAIKVPKLSVKQLFNSKQIILEKTQTISVKIYIDLLPGKVTDAEVLNGHPLLSEMIKQSAMQTTFYPTLVNSRPIYATAFLVYKVKPNGDIETKISDEIILGEVIELPKASFPAGADLKGKESIEVLVETEIDEKGYVISAEAVEGYPLLRNASVSAARRARFTPTYENGKTVKAIAKILYTFLPFDRDGTEVEVKSVRVQRTVISGHFLVNVKRTFVAKPDYPKGALAANIKGEVTVKVLVDEFGNVLEAEIVTGHPLLQEAAIQAAKLTKFEPPKLSNKPVNVVGFLTYNFN